MFETYGARQLERRLGQLFQQLYGDGALSSLSFNLVDGTEMTFARGQRWLISAHEYGIEIRRQSKGFMIMYGSIVSIHLDYVGQPELGEPES